jgi:hypothetical protein
VTDREKDLARFTDMVDAHGPDPARWPADRRDWGRAFVDADVDARAILAEARFLDAVIADSVIPPPSPEFADRIRALAADLPQDRPQGRPAVILPFRPRAGWRLIPAAAALAASLLAGFVLGATGLAADPTGIVTTSETDDGSGLVVRDGLGTIEVTL